MSEKNMKKNYYISKIRRQGSGLHVYLPKEYITLPNFPLKEDDAVVITLVPKKKMIVITKVEWKNLVSR
jgi:antitoxin component of MazEF toxin-antitoxin module